METTYTVFSAVSEQLIVPVSTSTTLQGVYMC